MLKRKRDRQVGGAMASVSASATGTGAGTGTGTVSASSVNAWCPGETAFTTQRLILQCYFSGEVEDKCTICLENLEQKMTTYLPCKHVFHYKCWQKLVEQRTYTCPLCRANFSETLSAVGIETAIENDNTVMLTIFTHMDLYDFMLEFLWRNYEREAEREMDEEE